MSNARMPYTNTLRKVIMEHFHCLFYDKINTRKVLINKHPVKASTTTTNVKYLHTNITRYVLSFPKK